MGDIQQVPRPAALQPFRKPRHVTLIDGGLLMQLELHVDEPVDGHPLWCSRFLVSKPRQVLQTHLDYLRVGAEIIVTNTYQASVEGFRQHLNLDHDSSIQLITSAVDIVKMAISIFMEENPSAKRPLIAGSVGPYAACLHDGSEYSGSYAEIVTATELARWHRPRILALLAAGVDLLAFETIPASMEAQVLVDLLSEFPETRAWLSFSCKGDDCMAHGEPFAETARACWKRNPRQLVAVGVNCLNPKYVAPLLRRVNLPGTVPEERIPLVVYPNSGESYHSTSGWDSSCHVPSVSSYVDEWLDLGVDLIGGCCRTSPEDTKLMRAYVDAWNSRARTGSRASAGVNGPQQSTCGRVATTPFS